VLRLHAGRTQPLPLRRASASAAQELLDCGRERLRGAEPREEQRGLLLGRGLSQSHVFTPDTPNTIICNKNSPSWLQHISHHTLHTSMTCSRKSKGHWILGLEDVLGTSFNIIHNLTEFWMEMSNSWLSLSLKDSL